MGLYEDLTVDDILNRMLDEVPDNLDKRVGSLIYNALAPAATELKQLYIELDVMLNETFADKASRAYLIKRAAERGIVPFSAETAVFKGVFDTEIPIGARFTAGDYVVVADSELSLREYRMRAEMPGSAANSLIGSIVPVEYIAGLTSAELTELLVPGEDEEDTEALRKRYFNSFDAQSFGGNRADYIARASSLPGVGGVKASRTPAGGGTVGIVVIDSTFAVPSATLINDVQTAMDPVANAGDGFGIAPIGHTVTVTGVVAVDVDIATTVTFAPGWDWPALEPYAIDEIDKYFLELRQGWQNEAQIIVRIAQIDSRLLNLTGVVDIEGTTLNGATVNKVLLPTEVPKRGTLSG